MKKSITQKLAVVLSAISAVTFVSALNVNAAALEKFVVKEGLIFSSESTYELISDNPSVVSVTKSDEGENTYSIYCENPGTASVYGVDENRNIKILFYDFTVYPTNSKYSPGDVNNDGVTDTNDLKLLQQYLTNQNSEIENFTEADMDSDGDIDVFDVIQIKRYIAYNMRSITEITTAKAYAEEMLELVNEERASLGIAPLKLNDALTEAATARADETIDLFSHTRPDGRNCSTVLDEFGIDSQLYRGENIAMGKKTPAETFEQWKNSPGHYANMISTNASEIGIGYVHDPRFTSDIYHYWVQLFI